MPTRNSSNIGKAFLLILLIIVLVVLGSILIDFVGNMYGVYLPIPGVRMLKGKALQKKIQAGDDPYLLEREELGKEKDRLQLIEEQLINKEREINEKNTIAEKKLETLHERENELNKKSEFLEHREKQYKDKQQNIREQAVKLFNMPPQSAVKILEKQSEADIVDILRAIDAYAEEIGSVSTSPYMLNLLSEINNDKAGNVLRKLKYSVGETKSSVEIDDEEDEIPQP